MTRYPKGMAALGAGVACALAALSAAPIALAQDAQPAAQPVSTAAPAPPPRPNGFSETVAAVVNDDIVSTYDLAQRMRLLIATSGIQPTQENLADFQHEALISLVDERLQFQELRRVEKEQKMEILADDSEINDEIEGMAQQNNMSREQFLSYLASRGIGADTLKQQLRAQISWGRWIRGRYGSRLRVGEDQIAATQARMAAEAAKPQFNIGEVLIDASRVGGMDKAMRGAQQLVAQMQQGAPFPAVARQFSALPTAANGGDAGWVGASDMPPEVRAVVEQMRPGQLSQPIPVKDGVYILYLKDKRAGGSQTMVSLKQVAIALPEGASADDENAAKAKLVALKPELKGCSNLEAVAGKTQGVVAGDLGEAELGDLAPQFREAAEKLKVGEVSDPVRTTAGVHLIAVCGRRAGGQNVADKQQIEQRLFSQQLSMISRRYMRDLRNSATIETR